MDRNRDAARSVHMYSVGRQVYYRYLKSTCSHMQGTEHGDGQRSTSNAWIQAQAKVNGSVVHQIKAILIGSNEIIGNAEDCFQQTQMQMHKLDIYLGDFPIFTVPQRRINIYIESFSQLGIPKQRDAKPSSCPDFQRVRVLFACLLVCFSLCSPATTL